MINITSVFQVVVALGLLNVWILRAKKSTGYRGRDAKTIQGEFAVYGLPRWTCFLVGGIKIIAAICLLVGLWYHQLSAPTAAIVAILMLGALSMHVKVKDPLKKTIPALCILAMCLKISLWP